MRVKSSGTFGLLGAALCLACLGQPARAQQPAQAPKQEPQPKQEAPAGQEAPAKQDAPAKQEAPAAKKNARPEGDAAGRGEPFDAATPEQLSKQCVTLATDEGAIEVEMLAEVAPESARNFLNLAATGAYDTTTFSRVVKGFVIQGGDLTTREKVTPELLRRASRRLPDEPSEVKHVRGVLSMARAEEPGSATTHFFILVGDAPHLDGKFSAFGRVRAGMEVVDRINAADVEQERPRKPVHITRATVAPCVPKPD